MKSSKIFTGTMMAPLLAIPSTALAQSQAQSQGIGFRAWGVRAGVSEDPDQFVAGVHVDFGEFAPHVRFQPSAEIGIGDDVFTLAGNIMVSYYFPVEGSVTPYAGGEISAAWYNLDGDCNGFGRRFGRPGSCDSSKTEIGPAAVGGIETPLKSGGKFLAEIQIGTSDLPDVKLVAGWTF